MAPITRGWLHHVYRIDDQASYSHRWMVHVGHRGRVVRRYFSDCVYGGKRKALAAAMACRDATLAAVRSKGYSVWFRTRKRRSNTSGITGVGRYVYRDRSRRRLVLRPFWQAFWDDERGQRRTRKFTVQKYGEARAKKLARRARSEALRELRENTGC